MGCAVYSPTLQLQTQNKISCYASVFTAESLDLLAAVQIIVENKLQRSSIFSDSLTVLQTLEHQLIPLYHKHYVLCQIKEVLLEAHLLNLEIYLIWIHAHVGIIGNERIDKLAKEATQLEGTLDMPIPFSDFYSVPRQRTKSLLS